MRHQVQIVLWNSACVERQFIRKPANPDACDGVIQPHAKTCIPQFIAQANSIRALGD